MANNVSFANRLVGYPRVLSRFHIEPQNSILDDGTGLHNCIGANYTVFDDSAFANRNVVERDGVLNLHSQTIR